MSKESMIVRAAKSKTLKCSNIILYRSELHIPNLLDIHLSLDNDENI